MVRAMARSPLPTRPSEVGDHALGLGPIQPVEQTSGHDHGRVGGRAAGDGGIGDGRVDHVDGGRWQTAGEGDLGHHVHQLVLLHVGRARVAGSHGQELGLRPCVAEEAADGEPAGGQRHRPGDDEHGRHRHDQPGHVRHPVAVDRVAEGPEQVGRVHHQVGHVVEDHDHRHQERGEGGTEGDSDQGDGRGAGQGPPPAGPPVAALGPVEALAVDRPWHRPPLPGLPGPAIGGIHAQTVPRPRRRRSAGPQATIRSISAREIA